VIVRIHFGSTISAGKTFFMSNSKGIQHSKHLLEMKCNAMQKKPKKNHPGAEERNQLGSQTLNISLTGQLIWS